MMSGSPKKAAPEDVALSPAALIEQIHEAHDERDERMATAAGRKAELKKLKQDEGAWAVYRTFCQFRLGYVSFLVMMVIVIFSFAFLMEIFFAVFLPSARSDPHFMVRSICLLILLPFAVLLLSYVFEESSRFFVDAIDKSEGGLNDFRLAVAVVIHFLRHRKEMPEDRLYKKITAQLQGESKPRTFLRRVSGFFLKNDPYNDKDKEEEDFKREEIEDEFNRQQAEAFAQDAPAHTEGTAASRWKAAKTAVQSTIAFKKTSFEGPALDFSTLVIVDFIFPVLFEVVSLWAFFQTLIASFSPLDAFMDYIQAGFFTSGFYLVIWIVCHFWSSRNRKMREYVSNYRRRRRNLKRALAELENEKKSHNLWLVNVGFRAYEYFHTVFFASVNKLLCCCKVASTKEEHQGLLERQAREPNEIEAAVEGEQKIADFNEDVSDDISNWNPWNKLSYSARFLILIPLTIASAVVSFRRFYLGWTIMGLCLIVLASTIQHRFPQIFGAAFRHFVTAFVILSLIFFSSTFLVGTFVKGGDFKILPPVNVSTIAAEANVTGVTSSVFASVAKYPVCTMDFSSLDIIDFALIADAVYGYNTSVQIEAFGERFNGTELGDWQYVARNDEKVDHQTWVELFFPTINMTVVAVRGTASAADALEDLHFWFGVSILQAVNVFVPFLRQLPTMFVVDMLSLNVMNSVMPAPVYSDLLQHVIGVKQRVGDRLVITGHSLGGAMAGMVGAHTKTPAVSFSGPGLVFSRGRFALDDAAIRDYVLTIKPRRDVVPRVDELGGMVQEIECRRMNPLSCHSTITHVCELHASCGDKRKRNWDAAEQCREYFGLAKK